MEKTTAPIVIILLVSFLLLFGGIPAAYAEEPISAPVEAADDEPPYIPDGPEPDEPVNYPEEPDDVPEPNAPIHADGGTDGADAGELPDIPFMAIQEQGGFEFPQKGPDGMYSFMGQSFSNYVVLNNSNTGRYFIYYHSNITTAIRSSDITRFYVPLFNPVGLRQYLDGAVILEGMYPRDIDLVIGGVMSILYSTTDILDQDGSVFFPANAGRLPPENGGLEEAIYAIRDAMPYLIIAVCLAAGAVIANAAIQELRKW
jgi:hypothetical protein